MIFKKQRILKDQVFRTRVEFVDFGDRDDLGKVNKTVKDQEQALIDNFGAPEVSIGGEFVGHVKVVDGKVTLVEKSILDAICITYVLSAAKANVTTGFFAEISVNAKKEDAVLSKLTAEQVAEAKCLVFEEVVLKRLEDVITALKAKTTTFESEVLDEIIIPVPLGVVDSH